MEKTKLGRQQWRTAQESLLSLEKSSVSSIGSIIGYVFTLVFYNHFDAFEAGTSKQARFFIVF